MIRPRTAGAIVLAVLMQLPGAVPASARPGAGGTELWTAREAGPHGAFDTSAGVAVSPDGSTVYVAATSDGAFVVDARDAQTGAERWRVRTPGPHGKEMFADAMALSADGGRLYVTGEAERDATTRVAETVAYDTADGHALWFAQLSPGTGRMAIPRRIAVSRNGAQVFVVGSRTGTHGVDDFWDFFTVGYDAATGAQSWTSTYDGDAHGGDTAEGLAISPDGSRVFVTGTSVGGATDRDFATIAYAATDGARRWVARYDEGADDWVANLVLSPDGARLYVGGYGRPSQAVGHRFLVVAYGAATGARRWVGRHDDGGDDMATDVALSPDGSSVFLTGLGGNDAVTAAFDTADGTRRWFAHYDGGRGQDAAYAVVVSPDGSAVFVAGMADEGRPACFQDVEAFDFVTVRYDAAAGQQGWAARYRGLQKDPDAASWAAMTPDGNTVVVSGDSDFGCVSSDVATVAYQTATMAP